MLRNFSEKSQIYFFSVCISLNKKLSLRTNQKLYLVVVRWANYMSLDTEHQSQVLQFRPMFLKIRVSFKKYGVTL